MNKVSLKEFDKAINELPKTNDIVSAFSSVSVKELRKAVERFEYVPSFNDLLEENNRLNNIINELEKDIQKEIDRTNDLILEDGGLGEITTIRKMLNETRQCILFRIKELKEGK